MNKLTVKPEDVCNALSFEAWNICLWGNPKAKIVCGSCFQEFKTRNYYPFERGKVGEAMIANCPRCGKWNILPVKSCE